MKGNLSQMFKQEEEKVMMKILILPDWRLLWVDFILKDLKCSLVLCFFIKTSKRVDIEVPDTLN